VVGNETAIIEEDSKDIIVVNAAPVSRSYFENAYDPNRSAVPTCWSADTQRPSVDVPQEKKQAARCMDCPQNIRGSGSNRGRACRFAQRLAVVFDGQLDEVYQLQLPATSIYGRGNGGHMPMQDYVKFLSSRGSVATRIITRVYFDEQSPIPKLYFKPIRSLNEGEAEKVSELKNHPDTLKAISLDVFAEPKSPFSVVEGFELNATSKGT
tara:strand:+ start:4611 stop:5240 length:630 start_codon:yes stop_codon:yes gene_type:complete